MAIITCADFAELAGVSRSAISQAAKPKDGKSPKLALEADGTINTDLPINAAYLRGKRDGKKTHVDTPAQSKARKSVREMVAQGDTVSPPANTTQVDDEDEELVSATLEVAAEKLKAIRARRLNSEADTRLKNLREASTKETLIPRELVRRKFAAFDASLKTNFRDLPRRIAAQVTALACSEGQAAAERYLEEQISAALERTKVEAQKQGLS